MINNPIEEERKLFENWFKTLERGLGLEGLAILHSAKEIYWNSWLARSNVASSASLQEILKNAIDKQQELLDKQSELVGSLLTQSEKNAEAISPESYGLPPLPWSIKKFNKDSSTYSQALNGVPSFKPVYLEPVNLCIGQTELEWPLAEFIRDCINNQATNSDSDRVAELEREVSELKNRLAFANGKETRRLEALEDAKGPVSSQPAVEVVSVVSRKSRTFQFNIIDGENLHFGTKLYIHPKKFDAESGLEEWAKGKFAHGSYVGPIYGNTDWALVRLVWSAAIEHVNKS